MDFPEWLEDAWRKTTKVLLGQELEDIVKYQGYLFQYYKNPIVINNSAVPNIYRNYKNVVKLGEKVEFDFNINDIKDIENLLDLVKNNFSAVGNVILGHSSNVLKSTQIYDSHYVFKSIVVSGSKYVAFSSYAKEVSYSFGCHDLAWSSFTINSMAVGGGEVNTRIFESFYVVGGNSDIYFSHNVSGCNECMFSFFIRGKKYVIGNVELSKDKYYSIKSSLLEQIRDDLKRKKLPSLFDLIFESIKSKENYIKIKDVDPESKPPTVIESSYKSTSKVILGKERSLVDDGPFLSENLPFYDLKLVEDKGRKCWVGGVSYYIPKTYREKIYSAIVVSPKINALSKDNSNFNSLEEVIERINHVAGLNFFSGKDYTNCYDSTICFHSSNVYRTVMPVRSKFSAYSFWPRESSHIFGGSVLFNSEASIRCYNSSNIKRSFEVESSDNVSDSYYCIACESVKNAIFSFGVVGKNYVILNKTVSQAEFLRVKSYLLEWINNDKYIPRVFEVSYEV